MTSLKCFKCGKTSEETDNFCASCGQKLKCTSCKAPFKMDSLFCSQCGVPIDEALLSSKNTLNTIKYRKSNDEISCEISFTDQIGKEGMSELVTAIVTNRSNFAQTQNVRTQFQENALEIKPPDSHVNNKKVGNDELSPIVEDSLQFNTELPHLNDLDSTVDCSESTWIAIHAFYLSMYGKNNFNKEEVKTSYANRRKTESRMMNFAREWKKAHQKYFKTVNENELGFQHGIVNKIIEIIYGAKPNSTGQTVKKNTLSSSKKTPSKSIKIEEFDVSADDKNGKPSLEEFMHLKQPGDSSYDRIVLIAYYITRIVKEEGFSEGQVEYAYKAIQLNDRPVHLRQTINNIKNAKIWFKDISKGKWSLERIGEIYVEEKLPLKKD